MPYPTARRALRRPSGGERVFTDDADRLWSAAYTRGERGDAVVFACVSDSRQAVRAIAVGADFEMTDAADETLRAWLREAPRIGRLT